MPPLPTPFILATRKSPLALVQAGLVADHLRAARQGWTVEQLPMVTSGDRQADWVLSKTGGKGLFTGELEEALRAGRAHAAVHSAKDLPGEESPGLVLAGFLPREDPRDVLIHRAGIDGIGTIATGSPRRRAQLRPLFPDAAFVEIRGNVETRLKKIAESLADATVLAAAGLRRLGIGSWPGLEFQVLEPGRMAPAVGQGAIAIQSVPAIAEILEDLLDAETGRRVRYERTFLRLLGAGCQTAFAAHATVDTLYLFHEDTGLHSFPLTSSDLDHPEEAARAILTRCGLAPGA